MTWSEVRKRPSREEKKIEKERGRRKEEKEISSGKSWSLTSMEEAVVDGEDGKCRIGPHGKLIMVI